MYHLLATVGYAPEKVTEVLVREGPISGATLFFGSRANPATRRAIARISRTGRDLAVPVEEVEIGSAYDFALAVVAYRRKIRARSGASFVFNLSGGTGIMQAAAAFVCFTEGIPFSYYNREDRRYVRTDVIKLELAGGLGDSQRRVLDHLVASGSRGARPIEVARRLRMSPTNVDHHLRRLRDRGLAKDVAPSEGRRGTVAATSLARLVL